MPIAFVIGGGEGVHAECEEATALCRGHLITDFLVNDQIEFWGGGTVAHGVSLHPAKLPGWLARRAAAGRPALVEVWSWVLNDRAGVTRAVADWGGSTGLLAVRAALASGFDRVVLCGVPMDADAGHFVRRRRWPHAVGFRRGWLQHRGELAAHVRSCAGWTRDLFGAPSAEWLKTAHGAETRTYAT